MLLPAGIDPMYVTKYGSVHGNTIRGVEMHLGAPCEAERCARSVPLQTWGFRLDEEERGEHDLIRALELRRSEVTCSITRKTRTHRYHRERAFQNLLETS